LSVQGASPAPASLAAFEAAIDSAWDASRSVALRYRAILPGPGAERDRAFEERLLAASQREGLRAFPLFVHRDVAVDVLDATSLMRTGTHKSVDGCVTTAHCLQAGHRRVVFESGGNTGTALTAYATRAGLETFLFVPADNLPLLDAPTFAAPGAHVIAVEDAREVKASARAFAEREGIPRVPELAWRHEAARLVGAFVLEHCLVHGRPDHFVQGISAAFAPIGIYRSLAPFREGLGGLPAFLGVQQAANCPMVRAWRGGEGEARPVARTGGLLARVMYDEASRSYGTFGELRELLEASGGDLTTIDGEEFERWLHVSVDGRTPLAHLAGHGVVIAQRGGDVVEKAGLMGLAATLREIESGRFRRGSRLLVSVTGGTALPAGRVSPERTIRAGGAVA
jgi:hypothetical protein